MTTTPDEAKDAPENTHESTAPASISTEDAEIDPAEREHQEIDANAFRASLKY
ncbi:hypothetical protein ABIB25_005640 [Nakamurella sp. UYEF19]|uniref:hypothetical protein n=1 Tax=Nakamurella sp. UYEF19 TaxID=1756392 RepID=UPI00339B212D